jgi:uncharacterized membrane protein YhaH (DUF805 family)
MNQGMNPYQAPSVQSLSGQAERDWKWLLFAFDGRATRAEYWRGTLMIFFPFFALIVLAGVAAAFGERLGTATSMGEMSLVGLIVGLVALAVMVPVLWASVALGVKRWHDRGKSGWWTLIGIVPYIGALWSFIECGCLRGTQGDNAYGPDPLA